VRKSTRAVPRALSGVADGGRDGPAGPAGARAGGAGGAGTPWWRALVARARAAKGRRLLTNALVVVITAAFCYVALRGIKLGEAWRALQRSDYWWLIPALAAFGLGNVARALRWRSLFPAGRRPPRGTTLNAMMIGYLYNNVLPARAGEAARVLVLTQRSSSPPVEIASTVVLERLFDIVGILVLFFLAQPWLPHVGWFGAAALASIVLAVVIALAAAALAVYGDRPLRFLLRPLRRLRPFSEARLEGAVADVVHGLSGLREWRVALEALLWTLGAWLCSMLCAYLLMIGFHLQLSFAAGVLVMVAVGLSMILPSAPAAVGVYEGATLIALGAFGVHHSVAFPYAVLLHLVNFLPFVLVGLVLLHYNSRHPRVRVAADGERSAVSGEHGPAPGEGHEAPALAAGGALAVDVPR
jgi:uncharacterized protein (TIRG00374 family)